MHKVVPRAVALMLVALALGACGPTDVQAPEATIQATEGSNDQANNGPTPDSADHAERQPKAPAPEQASSWGARVRQWLGVGREAGAANPALAKAERDAATEAIREAKATLIADVTALAARFDALAARVNRASGMRKAQLENVVRDLGDELASTRRQLGALEIAPGNEVAFQHGSLEIRVQWLAQQLREIEAALAAPPKHSAIAVRARFAEYSDQ